MNNPRVSICIPVYNGASYLRECLDSALCQTMDDFEIILVDDRSSDSSYAILQEYASKSTKIRLFQNETNLGLVGNWNRSVELAGGTWIKFLFQDDMLHPACLQKMLDASSGGDELIVSERHFRIEEQVPEWMKHYYRQEVLSLERIYADKVPAIIDAKTVSALAVHYLSLNFIGEPTTILFRKSMLPKLGVFDARIFQICDLEYFLRIATQTGLIHVPEALTTFRVHTSSATFTTVSKKAFTASCADPAILSGKLLHADEFALFRSYLTRKQARKLKEYHCLKLYEAQLFEARYPEQVSSQWNVLKTFPFFDVVSRGRTMTRVLYWLIRKRRARAKEGGGQE
ncbi:MAG TPA: glycosyltransferase family 2 protein [Bacteroidia bacterium]|jgi:glycosyltransferase involved in cell wall biosynthesis|nr:glycosyltransferase family 2 protein [Bacteroidia bacterium]